MKHTQNEDRCVVLPDLGVFAVADGMGGHSDGAHASAAVVDGLTAVAAEAATGGATVLEHCLARVNGDLRQRAWQGGRLSGATVAAILVRGARFTGLWAGDSRIYHLHGSRLVQVSHDHSEVQDLVDGGVLSESDARHWPRRHVVTRAIGVRNTVDIARAAGDLDDRDGLVLCSDGLTGTVEPGEIAALVGRADPQGACDALVGLARERGETDDVTVVVVRFSAAPDGRIAWAT